MYCESCGSFIQDGDAFCSACGAPAPIIKAAAVPPQAATPVPAAASVPPANGQPVDQDGYTYSTMEVGPDLAEYKVPQKASTLSAVSLGFGMVAVMMCWYPGVNFVMATPTLIMAIIVLAKKMNGKGYAIASVVCASISIFVGIIELMWLFK